ncbi:MAG TPA: type II toxin-antitoxin system VapC family toxin [Rudaea sp.]|jgi:tRNA(fMet)-specific endonuclease VapC|nr:type II toxin-antitoxin system VapC family toxin [Rudaea sp.]
MIFLDTNICIAALKNDRRVLSHLLRHQGRIFLPFVVSAELWFGLEKSARAGSDQRAARARVEEFHDRIDGVVYSDDRSVREYARVRADLEHAGKQISPNDTWIAAQALSDDALLVSANSREFKRIPHLRLENWLKS